MPQRRSDEYDRAYTLASRLKKAGVKFCISGTERSETWNARNLAYHAATAVTFGLSPDEAIRSITLSPAEILGVDDRIGSLTVGKEASLIITDGNPLDIRTNVLGAFIQGRAVDLSNRQKRLYQKYQQKYE
jgi:imidazolonepropionase-like amidohydrolase